MRGLKIRGKWLQLILDGSKTMEVRNRHFKIGGMRIALGNSNTGNIEAYATVADVVEISRREIGKYENQHLATEWLTSNYGKNEILYGYILKDITRTPRQLPHPKSQA